MVVQSGNWVPFSCTCTAFLLLIMCFVLRIVNTMIWGGHDVAIQDRDLHVKVYVLSIPEIKKNINRMY